MRIWYTTDITAESPEYVGAFSAPFPAEDKQKRIVAVNWTTRGEVEVTWLIKAGE